MPTGVQVRGWGIVHLVRFPNPLAVGEPDWCPLGPICNIVPSLRLAWCIKIFTFSQLFSAHWCPSERLKWCPLGPMLTMAMSLFFWHGPTFPDVSLCSSFSQPFTTGEGLQHSYGIPVDQTGEKLLFFSHQNQNRWVPTSEKPVFLSFSYVGGTFGTIITYPVRIIICMTR